MLNSCIFNHSNNLRCLAQNTQPQLY